MATKLDQLRALPDYMGMSDRGIAKALAADNPDIPLERIAQELGITLDAPTSPPAAGRSLGTWAKDAGVAGMSGFVGIPESLVGLADMASGGSAGKVIENAGVDFKGAKQYWTDKFSPQQKAANAAVDHAEGFTGKLGAALSNPSTIGMSVVESLPAMALGGLAARGIMSVGPSVVGAAGPQLPGALSRAVGSVQKAAGIAGALGEGITMAGQNAEQIRQETGTLTPSQTLDAAAIGAAGAGFAMLGATVARQLGIHDFETMMAAGHANPAAAKGIVRRVLEGAFSEGILEELPQSIAEQVLQNKAMGKPLEEGVDQAAVMGMLAGAAMGAGSNAMGGKHAQHLPPQPVPAPVPDGNPLTQAAAVGATAQASGVATADPAKLTEAVEKASKVGAEQPDAQEAQDRTLNLEKIAAGVEPQPVHPLDEQASDAQWDHDAQVYADATGGAAVPPGGAPGTAASKRADYDDSGLGAVDAKAHEAAPSPLNARPEPTDAQKEAGNYKKGHVKVAGLDISIENPQGSERRGKRPDGTEWAHTMSNHYGYIKRTTGADDEQVDVYVGPRHDAPNVYVVDQVNQHDGSFDEHKVMLGFASRGAAVNAYKSNFDKKWTMGRVTEMPVDQFKTWLKDGDLKKPASPKGALTAKDDLITGATDATSTQPPAGAQAPDAGGAQPTTALATTTATPAALEAPGVAKFGTDLRPADPAIAAVIDKHDPKGAGRVSEREFEFPIGTGLGDVRVQLGDDGVHTVKAEYMGQVVDERRAEGAPALDAAIERAKAGIQEFRERMARQKVEDSNAGSSKAPALDAGGKDAQRADGTDVPAGGREAAPVAAVASSPAAPAPAVAAPAPAAVGDTPAARWMRMPHAQREALIAARTAAKNPGQIAGRSWEELHPSWHKTIERALKEEDAAAPVAEKQPAAPAPSPAPAPAPQPAADRTQVIDNSATNPGEFIVKGDGHNLARFQISTSGKPTRIKHFFEATSTRDMVQGAIDRFVADRTPVTAPAPGPAGKAQAARDNSPVVQFGRAMRDAGLEFDGTDVRQWTANVGDRGEVHATLSGRDDGIYTVERFLDGNVVASKSSRSLHHAAADVVDMLEDGRKAEKPAPGAASGTRKRRLSEATREKVRRLELRKSSMQDLLNCLG